MPPMPQPTTRHPTVPRPSAGLYAFPSDLADEGVGPVLRACTELGTDTLVLAVAYHQARDLVPHAGDKPRIRYRKDSIFLQPTPELWSGVRLRPALGPADEVAAVDALLAAQHRPTVEAWTVFCHNTGLGEQHPEAASVTCFGDRILSNLCPSQPDVVAYARALAGEAASRGLDVVAEALSAQTFGHGHHHERSFISLDDLDQALLGLCFCTRCTDRAAGAGADPERLADAARRRLQRAFAGEPGGPASPDALAAAVGADVLTLLAARQDSVTELASAVAEVVHGQGRRLSFMDLTGAVLGYDDGAPTGPFAADQAWRLAIDPGAVAPLVDSYTVLGYVRDPERLAADVASVHERMAGTPQHVILRPGHPDTRSAGHLADKIRAARDGGAARVDFYTYGMSDHSVLARIPGALEAGGRRGATSS